MKTTNNQIINDYLPYALGAAISVCFASKKIIDLGVSAHAIALNTALAIGVDCFCNDRLTRIQKVCLTILSAAVSSKVLSTHLKRFDMPLKTSLFISTIQGLAYSLIGSKHQPPRPEGKPTVSDVKKMIEQCQLSLNEAEKKTLCKIYAQDFITFSEVLPSMVLSNGSVSGRLYLGGNSALSSLYKKEENREVLTPDELGLPLKRNLPEVLKTRVHEDYDKGAKLLPVGLNISAVAIVGQFGLVSERPTEDNLKSGGLTPICVENFSEESHESFMHDFQSNFEKIYREVVKELTEGKNVMICCAMAEHRSAIVTVAVVMKFLEISPEKAENWVREKRPAILPDTGNKKQNLHAALRFALSI